MIPTMILFGLVLGRWWRLTLVAAALLWPAILLMDGTIDAAQEVLGAAALGVANASLGIAMHQAVLFAARRWARAAGQGRR